MPPSDHRNKKINTHIVRRNEEYGFSILSKVSNEHIEEEKIKLLKQVIENLDE